MNKLEIINLTKKYGNKTALNNFTYTFENGVYGLIGPNGAGKSTLMNILVDGISKTNGDVLYNGEKIEKLGKEYRNIIGYVPQQQGIYNNFSAEDFLNYMANLKGLNKKDISSKIKEVLEFVDLYGVRKNKLGGFSGGMKQRILIAQALLNNPEILILDEPTAGLDPKERIRIRNLIARISMNKIVIISTHIVSDIEFIAGNIVFLYGGELIRKGSPKELLKELENQVFEKIISEEQVENYTIRSYHPTVTDRIIGFLINPVIQGLLIMVIVGGIYFELQTPGIGFPLAAALTACLLYFAPLYLEGFAGYWEIIAFVVGVVLLLLEIFVIPGFGVAGISGIVLIIVALVFAGIDHFSFRFLGDFVRPLVRSLFLVVSASLVSLLMSMWLGAKLFGSRRWAFALHAEQKPEDGYVGVDLSVREEIGKQGIAVTDLRPAGKVEVGGEVYDAVSLLGDYIEKGNRVMIKKYQAGQVYVVKCEK